MSPPPSRLLSGFHYAVSCIQGLKGWMEDTHKATTFSILPLASSNQSQSQYLSFFGLFDGHRGRKAADFSAENLGQNIVDALVNVNLNFSSKDVEDKLKKKIILEEAVRAGYLKTDEEFSKQGVVCGSTSVTALIIDGKLVVSNAGDSRAVMSRKGEAEALTCDHKAGREDEQQRIKNLGGRVFRVDGVWRVQGALAVTRAIGNADFGKLIPAEPDTRIIEITSDCEFLILASDGLWDAVSDQNAVDIARPFCLQDQVPDVDGNPSEGPSAACQKLVELAVARKSVDDITVMIVQLSHFCKD